MLARDVGFMNAPALKGWAERHPQIWGNRHGDRMFAGNGAVAFGKPPFTPVMVSAIVAWWRAAADRLDAAIPVHADRPAALAALQSQRSCRRRRPSRSSPARAATGWSGKPRPVSLPSLQR